MRWGPLLWALLPLLTWSLLAPVVLLHAAVRLRSQRLWLLAVGYTLVWLAVGPLDVVPSVVHVDHAVLAFSQAALVVTATAYAFVIRERVFPPPPPPPQMER